MNRAQRRQGDRLQRRGTGWDLVQSAGVGALLALITCAFAAAVAGPLGVSPMAVIAATGAGLCLHLAGYELLLVPALPASALVIGGAVGSDRYLVIAAIAGLVAVGAARVPRLVRAVANPRVTGVLQATTGAALLMTVARWVVGPNASVMAMLAALAHGSVNWSALVTVLAGLTTASMVKDKATALALGTTTATAVGLFTGASKIGSLTAVPVASSASSASLLVTIAIGLLMSAILVSEAASAADAVTRVAGRVTDAHAAAKQAIYLSGVSTALAGLWGVPALGAASARSGLAASLRANLVAVGCHLGLLCAIYASTDVAQLVGELPTASLGVLVVLSAVALIPRNLTGWVTAIATVTMGPAGGALIGLAFAAAVRVLERTNDGTEGEKSPAAAPAEREEVIAA